jgi:hypothetical protein
MFVYEVLEVAGQLKEALERFQKETLTNKEAFTLDERWAAYEKVAEYMPTESYSDGDCETLLGVPAYDAGIERYQTMDYPALYEWYLDRVNEKELYPEDEDEYNANLPSQEVADEWRERVLAAGYGSFEHDW